MRMNPADSLFPEVSLHGAVVARDLDLIRALLDQGHDVDGLDCLLRTPLTAACDESGEMKRALQLEFNALAQDPLFTKSELREGKSLNKAKTRVQKCLDRAAEQFRPEALKRAERSLAGEADTDPKWQAVQQRIDRITRMVQEQYANRQAGEEQSEDDPTTVQLLLDCGADIEGEPGFSGAPLTAAARNGRIDTMRLLIARGAGIDGSGQNTVASTPLTAACTANRLEAARLLIEHGADYRQTDSLGETGLHAAARGGNIAMVRLMLSLGLEVDLLSGRGVSPLAYAAMADNKQIVKFLQDKHAAVHFLDAVALGSLDAARSLPSPTLPEESQGWAYPVAQWAVRYGNTAALQLLTERGLRIVLEDFEACAILTTAILRGDTEALTLLMPKGRTIQEFDSEPLGPDAIYRGGGPERRRMSALGMVVTRGDYAMARTLIRLGADCNQAHAIVGLLGSAVNCGDQEMVRLLIDGGADVNGSPDTNMSPLLLAVVRDDPAMVALLLERGADPRAGIALTISRVKPEILAIMIQHMETEGDQGTGTV